MRIEVTEDRLSDMDADTGQHYSLSKGDIVTVPDAYGKRLCAHGWVKDVDGKVESATRVPGVAALEVQKAKLGPRGRQRG